MIPPHFPAALLKFENKLVKQKQRGTKTCPGRQAHLLHMTLFVTARPKHPARHPSRDPEPLLPIDRQIL
jgi:hypothetical protein